jgi:hypothetical protein
MANEPIYTLAKDRIIDEPTTDEQRELLKTLLATCFVRPNQTTTNDSTTLLANLDFADQLYSDGKLLPKAYCYLAFILKLLELSELGNRDWSQNGRFWVYVAYSTPIFTDRKNVIISP